MDSIKQSLRQGRQLLGTMITTFASHDLVIILKNCGFDFCMVDCEHGSFTTREVSDMISGGRGCVKEQCGAQIAFAPSVEEIYPEPDTRTFSYPPTDSVMEGAMRPGHFNGVCQIVSKLFSYTSPDRAYFGEKDYQQIAVIRRMVADLGFQLAIVSCPVIREESGLAMSSRNTLLTDEERALAANIYRVMQQSRNLNASVSETHDYVVDNINAIDGLEVQYFSIVDGDTLADISLWQDAESVVGCITVFCGSKPIRLIDHIRYK